jgi:hypothetical protein
MKLLLGNGKAQNNCLRYQKYFRLKFTSPSFVPFWAPKKVPKKGADRLKPPSGRGEP